MPEYAEIKTGGADYPSWQNYGAGYGANTAHTA